MEAWILEHLNALWKALAMIGAGTALVLYLLGRAEKTSGWPRSERRREPRK